MRRALQALPRMLFIAKAPSFKETRSPLSLSKFFDQIGAFFRSVIDFFYPPFSRYFSKQFFRYGATGCFNLAFDWTLYFVIYNLILHHHLVDLGIIVVSSHIAALGFKFPITLLTGFLMQKYVTFSNSALRGRVQLFRYLVVFFINLIINYIGLKILVDTKSFLYLFGTELQFSDGLNGKGFQFVNPNASRTCGCGESFAL